MVGSHMNLVMPIRINIQSDLRVDTNYTVFFFSIDIYFFNFTLFLHGKIRGAHERKDLIVSSIVTSSSLFLCDDNARHSSGTLLVH